MCYDAEVYIKKQLLTAQSLGVKQAEIDSVAVSLLNAQNKLLIDKEFQASVNQYDLDDLPQYYHVSGFAHPNMAVLVSYPDAKIDMALWGFIPKWIKNKKDAYDFKKPYNSNLNAQSENMYKSDLFKDSAKYRRCVIQLEAYYESHHQNKTTYPFRISHAQNKPLWVAGIYEENEFVDQETGECNAFKSFAILTCPANGMLSKIHNNPKMVARTGHRMLVILDESQLESYLEPYPSSEDPQEMTLFNQKIQNLCQPYDEALLAYEPVRNLRPRKNLEYLGNVPEIRKKYDWPDLNLDLIFG